MQNFLAALQNNDYATMYALLSKASQSALTQDAFSKKYDDALNTMGAAKIDFQILSQVLHPSSAQVGFQIIYHTALVGDIQRNMTANFDLEQGQWRLQWDDSLILPELAGGNVLKMDYQVPARGDIYDHTGLPIVTQSDAYALGITPGQMTNKSEGVLIGELSKLCSLTQDSIKAAYANAAPDWYVPICDASADEIKGVLDLGIAGLTATPYNSRFYLDQGIAPQVVGYTQLISAEQLNNYRRLGYRGDEKVGQSGIEKSMEQYLAGKHGGSLYVVDPNGQIVTRLANSDPQPADSVYLTIDRNMQYWAQQLLSGYDGSVVVLERDTGRVLAMASSPGYDQNLFDPNNVNSSVLLRSLIQRHTAIADQPRSAEHLSARFGFQTDHLSRRRWKAGYIFPKPRTIASTISLSFNNMAGRCCTTGPGNTARPGWQREGNAIPVTASHPACSPCSRV